MSGDRAAATLDCPGCEQPMQTRTFDAHYGRTVDLGSGEVCSIREIVQQLRDLVPGAPEALFGAVPDRPLERLGKGDVATSYKLIGWNPSTTLQAGLRRTVDWYKSRTTA